MDKQRNSKKMYSLHLKMIVLLLRVLCSKMIVRDQMFIDFIIVENFARRFDVPNNFFINKINKRLISNNHFGTKTLGV